LLILIGYGITVPYIHYEFYAVLFGILILNLAANKNTLISLENKAFHYLGKISYGLYMYHMLGIVIAFKGLKALGINNIVLLYLASMLLTVIISGLSYSCFERFFIKKKIRFSKVISGDNSK
jgi:peptidoglycan/LPS O-acetylase OafA/YrhL